MKHQQRPSEAILTHDPKSDNVPQVVEKILHVSNYSWPSVKIQVGDVISEIKVVCEALRNSGLVMPPPPKIEAIEKAYRFPGLFQQRILERLKSMPGNRQNTQRDSLRKFKKGDVGKQLWLEYKAAGHTRKTLRSQIGRIMTKEGKEKGKKARATGDGAADSEHEEEEEEEEEEDTSSEEEDTSSEEEEQEDTSSEDEEEGSGEDGEEGSGEDEQEGSDSQDEEGGDENDVAEDNVDSDDMLLGAASEGEEETLPGKRKAEALGSPFKYCRRV
jgi:hypothetical protein